MLTITIPEREIYNEFTNEFIQVKETTLKLEHSLVSVSKWEQKWKVPFIGRELTYEEIIDYIRCMTTTQNVDPNVYRCLTNENLQAINDYISDKMTATWFGDKKNKKKNNRIVTTELIYCWMISLNIPMECQRWHLNRLITLIEVCSEENKPPEKMSKKDLLSRNKAINDARKKALHTRG